MTDVNRRRYLRVAVATAAFVALTSGCAVTEVKKPGVPYTGVNPVKSIYVYSFLDLREDQFGRIYLEEVAKQFRAELLRHDVASSQVTLSEWLARDHGKPVILSSVRSGKGASTLVPIGEIISTNRRAETAFNPSHRLVIFPESAQSFGNGKSTYAVRWDIFDASSGNKEWTTMIEVRHKDIINGNDNAEGRAKILVDSAIAEMRRANVLLK